MPESSIEMNVGGYTVRGFSRAGLATGIIVEQLGAMLDCGYSAPDLIGGDYALISHEHPDHFVALPQALTMRRLLGHDVLKIIAPTDSIERIAMFLEAGQLASARSRWRYELVGARPGDEIDLGKNRSVLAFAGEHTVPTLGYIVYDVRRKLLDELVGQAPGVLIERRSRGEAIDREVKVPLMAVSGDTTARGLEEHPDILRAQLLVAECTFMAPEHRTRAGVTQHTHLDELAPLLEGSTAAAILLYHLSLRYDRARALAFVERALSPGLCARVEVFL